MNKSVIPEPTLAESNLYKMNELRRNRWKQENREYWQQKKRNSKEQRKKAGATFKV